MEEGKEEARAAQGGPFSETCSDKHPRVQETNQPLAPEGINHLGGMFRQGAAHGPGHALCLSPPPPPHTH